MSGRRIAALAPGCLGGPRGAEPVAGGFTANVAAYEADSSVLELR